MKQRLNWLATLLAFVVALLLGATAPAQAQTAPTGPKVLVLYDAPPNTEYEKLAYGYAIMLRNLLGHFDADVTLQPVHQYAAGRMGAFHTTFYLGAYYDNPLPAAFLADAATTNRRFVWFKYNLWQLAGNPNYNFEATRGMRFDGLRGMNAVPTASNPAPGFFDTVAWGGLDFVKYYKYDSGSNTINADPDIGVVSVVDPAKAKVSIPVKNARTGESLPYVARAGNFWYWADVPFSFIGPRDRYLIFAEMLHNILGIDHPEQHRAMVRLEDVGAMVSVSTIKQLSNYLANQKVPFSIATIPHYRDPFGVYNDGVPVDVPMSQATNLRRALDYAVARGGEIVLHGYTHQYGNMKNANSGVSGDDYEFWNMAANTPMAEDSVDWAGQRMAQGRAMLQQHGYNPQAWETPHYQGSALSSRAAAGLFNTTYQRVVYYTSDKPDFHAAVGKDFALGQIYPYIIQRDHYGQRVLPEGLGNIEYDLHWIDPTANYNYTWQDIVTNARYMKVVRDGFASFFFHPFLLEPELGVPGYEDFKKTIEGITRLGYTWVSPSKLQ